MSAPYAQPADVLALMPGTSFDAETIVPYIEAAHMIVMDNLYGVLPCYPITGNSGTDAPVIERLTIIEKWLAAAEASGIGDRDIDRETIGPSTISYIKEMPGI